MTSVADTIYFYCILAYCMSVVQFTLYSWIGCVHLLGGGDDGVTDQFVEILDQLDGSASCCRQ